MEITEKEKSYTILDWKLKARKNLIIGLLSGVVFGVGSMLTLAIFLL